MFRSLCFIALLTNVAGARSDVMFEGYSKVVSQGQHVGYVVQRYEFDKNKKLFSVVSFTRLGEKLGNTTESIKATCSDKFEPKSFAYTLQSGDTVKTVDGSFKGGQMTLKTMEGKKTKTEKRKLPKGIFLSSFLGYLMLQNGYKVGKKFSYQAIAEEDGGFENGQAFIQKEEKSRGQDTFRILNEFKKTQYISFVTPRGEILETESPAQSLATELVKDSKEATKDQSVPNSTLKLLFGSIPEGKKNIWFEAPVTPITPATLPSPPAISPSKSP